tara:strand:+ start:151 stop:756 length:606 start_codon:yes stop_codon:yes gene_type:complete
MKLVLFFFINIIFSSNALSHWVDTNIDIINSQSYKIVCSQIMESSIGTSSIKDEMIFKLIYLNDSIKIESKDKVIVVNRDSVKTLNRYSNQIFIDYPNNLSKMLLSVDINDLLMNAKSSKLYEDIHLGNTIDDLDVYVIQDTTYRLQIFFSDTNLEKIDFIQNKYSATFHDIKLANLDTVDVINFLNIGNKFSEIFDLRYK